MALAYGPNAPHERSTSVCPFQRHGQQLRHDEIGYGSEERDVALEFKRHQRSSVVWHGEGFRGCQVLSVGGIVCSCVGGMLDDNEVEVGE